MSKIRILYFLMLAAVLLSVSSHAAEENFVASSLEAKDVNCKKCHTDSPHIIHAVKPVECVNCHGDKLSVSIPACTKCHNGPIHKVHEGKVNTQACSYCHKNIESIHNNLISDAVCSHCHKNLIEVHGQDISCGRCHRSPPNIVKPVRSPEMTVVCQACHVKTSVATVHGEINDKTGCYNCHKGTSSSRGSDIPHIIHAAKVDCQRCHEEQSKVVIPQCTRCHDIETIHAFTKIGKLTAQTGLQCSKCHTEETKLLAQPVKTSTPMETVKPPETVISTPQVAGTEDVRTEGVNTPGFGLMAGILSILFYLYIKSSRK